MTIKDEIFMQRCLDLALHGAGHVAPNPLVGAVIVHDQKIIGESSHACFGRPHAEVNAINSVNEKNKVLLPHSTLYVNLEPCCHHGKTPPCTDLIIKTGIKKVVIANKDPHKRVAGKGIRQLEKADVQVVSGLLADEGAWLNRRFFTFHQKTRPYIILKWAQSADGFFTKNAKQQHWITGEASRKLTHRWRSEESAIMVGTNTVKADNPQLTNRFWMTGKQPLRVVLDRKLQLPKNRNVFDSKAKTIVFTEKNAKASKNIEYIRADFGNGLLKFILQTLYDRGILSIMVEGGTILLNEFIREQLWDEARIFTGKVFFQAGVTAPLINGKLIAEETIGNDRLRIFINK